MPTVRNVVGNRTKSIKQHKDAINHKNKWNSTSQTVDKRADNAKIKRLVTSEGIKRNYLCSSARRLISDNYTL